MMTYLFLLLLLQIQYIFVILLLQDTIQDPSISLIKESSREIQIGIKMPTRNILYFLIFLGNISAITSFIYSLISLSSREVSMPVSFVRFSA